MHDSSGQVFLRVLAKKLSDVKGKSMMRKKRITMDSSAPMEEVFKRFLLSKKSMGLAEKTLESYQQHFIAIQK